MRAVLPQLIELLTGPDRRAALARVIATTGPSPRDVGATMLIAADGTVTGSLSGGCVESTVVHTAMALLENAVDHLENNAGSAPLSATEVFGAEDSSPGAIDLAPGLTCGGEIEVFIECVDADRLPVLHRLAAALAEQRSVALATTLDESPAWFLSLVGEGERWRGLDVDVAAARDSGVSAVIGTADCEQPAGGERRPRTFVHSFTPPPRLILVGANDFVRAISGVGRDLGYRVSVVDARPVFATRVRFPDADEVIVRWPDGYLREEVDAGRVSASTTILVMTHDHKFDVPSLQVALSSAAGFIGALGSRRAHTDRTERLRAAGVGRDALNRLRSPLGLDLGGHSPAEAAISIAAQLIAERHGATGRALDELSGPIHRR